MFQIQNPDVRPRRRTRTPGMPESSTQRGMTLAEIEDIRLAKQRHQQEEAQQQQQRRSRGQVRFY